MGGHDSFAIGGPRGTRGRRKLPFPMSVAQSSRLLESSVRHPRWVAPIALLSGDRRSKRPWDLVGFAKSLHLDKSVVGIQVMRTRSIHDDELHAHFITFSCYRRRRLLDHDRAKRALLGILSSQLASRQASCTGFVVMPDHVHAIVWFPVAGQLSVFVQQWKRLSSHGIAELVRQELIQYAEKIDGGDPFWQAKYYSFNLYDEDKVREKLTYMHENPVRAGLVAHSCDWAFSSARYYEQGRSVGVPVRWVG
jgi:putative transposase